jgi:hypothetical protein
LIKDERWPIARLIPVTSASGVEARERCSASALLAVMSAVYEFGRAILRPLGAPAGKVETFVEVPFRLGNNTTRPDGVITVTRGSRTWGALVEVKTGANDLEEKQVDAYLDLARQLEFDALLTISNQYVTHSSDLSVAVDRKKLRRVRPPRVLHRRGRPLRPPTEGPPRRHLRRSLDDRQFNRQPPLPPPEVRQDRRQGHQPLRR